MARTAMVAGVAALAAGLANAGGYAMNMNVGDTRHGFVLKGCTELPEVGGRLWRMEYAKNGADLAWLERKDDNMTFGVSFRTLPGDDTGVAHIIEHSVLCGSKKYPVKEPFVNLLKSSLSTFLNAYTDRDQTVYPVSSRNGQDFLNLMDVYLDAVFHPLSAENPVMFRQEGWHYEFGKDGSLVRNGVVYNEMKGVYADPISVAFEELYTLLLPDTPYRFDSGGDPAHIAELTFEGYRDFYRKYYHPSNARIFLDGSIDLDAVLARLDACLSAYERRDIDADIPVQKPVARSATVPYAIGADESPDGKSYVADGWVFGAFGESGKKLAMDVLSEALTGSNEAPLKKALLERGLCEDVWLCGLSHRQLGVCLVAKHVPDGKAEEFRRTAKETLSALAANGLDRTRLASILDRKEFETRELFSGGGTCGVKFLDAALRQWLYGGDPADAFRKAEDFRSLRAKLSEGWFEKFLKESLVENPHHARLDMTPSATLSAERAKAERDELARTLAGWSDADRERAKAEIAVVDAFRNKVDSPEDVAKLPVLSLFDIPRRGKERRQTAEEIAGTAVLRPVVGAKGVFYVSLRFSLDDFTVEELARAQFLAVLLGELATGRRSAIDLHTALDAGLGRFETFVATYAAKPGDVAHAHTVFAVDVAALDAKADAVCSLVPEVLLDTRFTDKNAVTNLVRQCRLARESDASTTEAVYIARRRAAAAFSAKGVVEDALDGITQLRHLQRLEKDFAADPKACQEALAALARRIFVKGRLLAVVSENAPAAELAPLFAAFPRGAVGPVVEHAPLPRQGEGFTVAGESAYTAKCSHLPGAATGAEMVAAHVLSLTYLWEEIRVKGGAYGGSLKVAPDGEVGFLAWRDPTPKRSMERYASASSALRSFAAGDESLDAYVVGTVGGMDPCLTPQGEVKLAAGLHFSGRKFEDLQTLRAQALSATKADVARFADVLDRLDRQSSACIIGGEASVSSCADLLDKVESVTAQDWTEARRGSSVLWR